MAKIRKLYIEDDQSQSRKSAKLISADVSIRSNEYLSTLGHFFRALDAPEILSDLVLISRLYVGGWPTPLRIAKIPQ